VSSCTDKKDVRHCPYSLTTSGDERRTANQRCNTAPANEGVAGAGYLLFGREGLSDMEIP
jgi:hypothetical protein